MKSLSIIISVCVCMIFVSACDSRRAASEKAKQQFKLTEEQSIEQSQNMQKVMEQINTYYNDFGDYPRSLEELKDAGYEFPAEPIEGWQWMYRVTEAGPQLFFERIPQN